MSSEKKGFNIIYMPERGESRSLYLSSIGLFLGIVVLLVVLFGVFRAVNRYQYYKAEYTKIAGLSLEETEQLQQEELASIEIELKLIEEMQEKNLVKMNHIAEADAQNRTRLKLINADLDPTAFLSNVTRSAGYFNNVSNVNLQVALSIEDELLAQKQKLDQIITDNEVIALASDSFLKQWDRTPIGFPLPGRIDPGFGYRIHPVFRRPDWHTGVDISGYLGQEIKATAAGRVIQSGRSGGYGNVVIISHRDGIQTLYAHNSVNLVHEGDMVTRGQVIAKAGRTGTTTCVHVHYEVRYGSEAIDPERFNNLVKKYVIK